MSKREHESDAPDAPGDCGTSRRRFLQGSFATAATAWMPLSARGADASVGVAPAVLKARENRSLSPYTGYTREHWVEIAGILIAGVLRRFGKESGMPEFVGVRGETAHFQSIPKADERRTAFDRSICLVAYYTAATGEDRVPGYEGSITGPYLEEVIRGTDPRDRRYWGKHPDYADFGNGLALAIQVSPRFLWEPLDAGQRARVLAYLADLAYTSSWDCNHWFFHMAPVPLLDRNGVDSNRAYLTERYERLFAWHRGDGWFFDGENRTFDLYNAWGFHLYNQFFARVDPVWAERFGERIHRTTRSFLRGYAYLFGRDGAPVAWGRSTTYRFGILAPLGWAMLNGDCPLAPGQARRLASGALRFFWDRGALSENGLLEPGFLGPNSVVAEDYVNRGSPYWAAHGFSCLLLPPAHPFWTAPELPMPADGAGGSVVLRGAQTLVRVSAVDGEARLFPVGQPSSHWGMWQREIKYCQHAYSSYLGWAATGEGGPDLGAGRSGYSLDGSAWTWRARPRMLELQPTHLMSEEDMQLPKPESIAKGNRDDSGEIRTHTLVGARGELHLFWHDSPTPHYLYLGGYAIPVPHGSTPAKRTAGDTLAIDAGDYHSIMRVVEGPRGTLVLDLVEPRQGWLHSHSFGGRGAFPHWQSDAPVPANTVVAVYVDGARGRSPAVPAIAIDRTTNPWTVTFDGARHAVWVPA